MGLKGKKDVFKGMDKAEKALARGTEEGLKLARVWLVGRMKRVTPWDTGNLVNSYRTPEPIRFNKKIRVKIVNIASYGVYVHEMPNDTTNWNKPGTGNKFMERPAKQHADRVVAIVVNRVNRSLKGIL